MPASSRGETIHCAVCREVIDGVEATTRGALRAGVASRLLSASGRADEINDGDTICGNCLRKARHDYLSARLAEERGQLTELESEISKKAADHASIAVDIESAFARGATPGQRIADAVARVGGSWPFVVSFCLVMALWISFNSLVLGADAYDPYPYILLNLGLSCLAALQAPIIMMSQNRTAARDRMQADEDFRINLKAELEIASLHDKIDHLLHTRWENLLEVQEEQAEMLRELLASQARPK